MRSLMPLFQARRFQMLVLSQTQMESFDSVARDVRRRRLVREVVEAAPDKAEIMGPQGVSDLVRFAEQRAVHFGFDDDPSVDIYLRAVLCLGLEFDRDCRVPWAGEVVALRDLETARRTGHLVSGCARFEKNVQSTLGTAARQLQALDRAALPDVRETPDAFWPLLERVWPELSARIIPSHRMIILRAAATAAKQLGLGREEIAVAGMAQMFLGVGCFADPQHRHVFSGVLAAPPPERGAAVWSALLGWAATQEHAP
jgi:hypothetical protein